MGSNRNSCESIATPPYSSNGSPTPSTCSSASLASLPAPDAASVHVQSPTSMTHPSSPWSDPHEKEDSYLTSAGKSILRSVSISSNKRDSLAPSITSSKLKSRLSMSSLSLFKRKRADSIVTEESVTDSLFSTGTSVSSSSTVSARSSLEGRSRSNSCGSQTSASTQDAVALDPTSCLVARAPILSLADTTAATLQTDKRTTDLLSMINTDQPSFCSSAKSLPPRRVLDLGCGDGHWIALAAKRWPATEFIGMDCVNQWSGTDRLRDRNDALGRNVRFIVGDFLHELKQFAPESFDHVRLGFLTLSLPKGSWAPLFTEVNRVLMPGGSVEFLDEAPMFATDSADLAAEFMLTERADPDCKILEDTFKSMLADYGFVPPRTTPDSPIRAHFFDRAFTAMSRTFGEPTPVAEVEVMLPPANLDGSPENSILVSHRVNGKVKLMPCGEVDATWARESSMCVRVPPMDVHLQGGRNLQLVLAHRTAMWKYMAEKRVHAALGPEPGAGVSEESRREYERNTKALLEVFRRDFDEAYSEYERSQRRRLGLSATDDVVNEWDDDEPLTPRRLTSPIEILLSPPTLARSVRLLRVYEARKAI